MQRGLADLVPHESLAVLKSSRASGLMLLLVVGQLAKLVRDLGVRVR